MIVATGAPCETRPGGDTTGRMTLPVNHRGDADRPNDAAAAMDVIDSSLGCGAIGRWLRAGVGMLPPVTARGNRPGNDAEGKIMVAADRQTSRSASGMGVEGDRAAPWEQADRSNAFRVAVLRIA